jgi:hypothetical protein
VGVGGGRGRDYCLKKEEVLSAWHGDVQTCDLFNCSGDAQSGCQHDVHESLPDTTACQTHEVAPDFTSECCGFVLPVFKLPALYLVSYLWLRKKETLMCWPNCLLFVKMCIVIFLCCQKLPKASNMKLLFQMLKKLKDSSDNWFATAKEATGLVLKNLLMQQRKSNCNWADTQEIFDFMQENVS